ncbi:afamin [Otolemur garnettii]|uniref:afamin n=1 Tax=Otolemur garnettii TaxID=30611 RepID=UPI000644553F|nr:afamin [Otolemur garnettii]
MTEVVLSTSVVQNDVLQEKICAMKGLPQKYNFSHCCGNDFERRSCFFLNKKDGVGFLPPFPTLDPEEKCQAFKKSSESFLNHYVYEVARRNPFVFAPTLLSAATRFAEAAGACCEDQREVGCFQKRAAPIMQYLRAFSSYQKNVCGALLKFGPEGLNSINIAVLSQKFPKVEFQELTSLLEDVSFKYDACCEGDVVGCIRSSSKVASRICSKQESISSKIKECCEKEVPERGECIIYSNKDDRPKDLSPGEAKFTDSENVCQGRDADPDNFFAEFTYEYSRNHPDLSIPEILRITHEYKALLTSCCNTENPPDCYRHAEDRFKKTTEKSLKIVQRECEHFQNWGENGLKYRFCLDSAFLGLTQNPWILPHLKCSKLHSSLKITSGFQLSWVQVDLVLGELCGVHKNRTINPAVDHCCRTNFAFRRYCFEGLEVDKTYVPPPTSKDLFTFPADLCQAGNEELQRRKDRFLVNLVKRRRELTAEQLQTLFTRVTKAVEKCCEAEAPEACFKEESPVIDG